MAQAADDKEVVSDTAEVEDQETELEKDTSDEKDATSQEKEGTKVESKSSDEKKSDEASPSKEPEKVEEKKEAPAEPSEKTSYTANFPSLAKYKLVFLGDLGVGKTSIITRFMFDSFETDYVATIGIDFLSKTLHLEDRTIRLQLWDTAGQERFRTLIPAYIRDSSVAVIVYDVTSRESLESSKKWIDDARNERNNDILIVLVGNKCDVDENEREVSSEEGKILAEKKETLFIETSAKQGYNVKALFKQIASNLPGLENVKKASQIEEPKQKLTLDPIEPVPESGCAC